VDPQQINIGPLPVGLGVSKKVLPATRYTQGGRVQYDVTVPVTQIVETLERPDHTKAIESNRKIDLKHAQDFQRYLLKNPDFVCPSVLVRVQPGVLSFQQVQAFDALHTAWGFVEYRLGDIVLLLLVDGQHRVLGIWLAVEEATRKIADLKATISQAQRNGDKSVEAEKAKELADWEDKLARLMVGSLTVQFVEIGVEQGRRLFVDINDNVKGVRADFRTYLDDRTAVGLITADVCDRHPLLLGRVETGQETAFGRTSKALLGFKGVSDIARAVLVGATGRVGYRIEDELKRHQKANADEVIKFLDLLVQYTDLRKVADNEVDPPELRYDAKDPGQPHMTMLASTTMLRVLAGVYHDLTAKDPRTGCAQDGKPVMTRAEVGIFFRDLGPLLREIPIKRNSLWIDTGAFTEGGAAPTGRHGDISKLTAALCDWARNGIPGSSARPLDAGTESSRA
jgi:DNA-sulfur modification-associated